MSKRELTTALVHRRVKQSSLSRRRYGAATDMIAIGSAFTNSELGYLADMTDLSTETLTLDPHLASCAMKRFAPLACADWDVTPAQAVERGDRRAAIEIADTIRAAFVRCRGLQDAIYDTAWAEADNRAASEVQWELVRGRLLPTGFNWVHPRDLSYGAFRELRIVDPFIGGGFRSDIGIDVEEIPGKFLFWKPRLFREHHEREGLNPRSVYWAFFKRFTNRGRLKLTELTALPWRILEVDEDAALVADSESIDRVREELEDLGGETTAILDRGLKLNVEWPDPHSGDLFKMTLEDVNAEISKLWLGNRMTSDPEGNRAASIIGKNEQEMLYQRAGVAISDRFQAIVDACVRVNWGSGAMHLAPKFQIRTAQQRDRDKELQRVRLFLGLGMTVAESEVREIAGFRAPIDDEKFLKLGASGGIDAMGNPLPGAIEIVDPSKPAEQTPAVPAANDAVANDVADGEAPTEANGIDGQEAAKDRAIKDALGLTAHYCDAHAGKTVPASAVYGSPETLVDRGVKDGAREISKWVEALERAVEGHGDAVSIRRALEAARLDVEPFARAVEKRIVHAAMLGALDADWEAENDRVVKPPAFQIMSGSRVEESEGERLARYGIPMDGGLALAVGAAVPDFVATPFADAIRIFKARNVLTRRAFDRLAARAKHFAFTVANQQSKAVIGLIKDDLTKALEEGDDLRRFSARLKARAETAGWAKSNPSHVETVFRTNTMSAYSRGREEQMTQPNVLAARPYWQILGVKDDRTRKPHGDALGKVLRADDAFWKRAAPPFGYNCFSPDTIVQGRIIGASRALYDGEFVELTTEKGRRLTVTANHPVLTAQGFAAAKTIRVGHELVCYRSELHRPRRRGAHYDEHQAEARIEDAFRALGNATIEGRATAARLDFHGEAERFVGQIDVVGSYVRLPAEGETARPAEGSDLTLVPANAAAHGGSRLDERAHRLGLPATRVVRGADLSSASLRRHAGPLHTLRIGAASELNAGLPEAVSQSPSRDAEFIRQLLHAGADAVSTDRVDEVREYHGSGHVFDLETEGGWLVADGIVASNCRCRRVSRSPKDVERLGLQVVSGASLTGLPDDDWDSSGGF